MATLSGMLALVLWSLLALISSLTEELPAFLLLAYCFAISFVLSLVYRAKTTQNLFTLPKLSGKQWLNGIFGLFGFHFCYFMALKSAAVIEVSLIVYIWPLLLSILVAGKANRFKAGVGGLLGFIGISFIILATPDNSETTSSFIGYVLAASCAFIWALYSFFLSKSDSKVEDIGWISLVVAVFSFIAHLTIEPSLTNYTAIHWLGIVLLGFGPVGGAFYLWDYGLKFGNQQLLASLSFFTPLFSSVWLALSGLNNWSEHIVLSLLLILIGATVTNLKIKVRLSKQPAPD